MAYEACELEHCWTEIQYNPNNSQGLLDHGSDLGGGFKHSRSLRSRDTVRKMVLNIFYFHPGNWGNDPHWLIFFKCVETTN